MHHKIMKYDIAVIGGGPGGMMAAGRAAQCGARVVLIEKNRRLGKKLLLTGKGRCNITNAEYDPHRFIEPFGKKGKFLYSALHKFGVQDTLQFFHQRGLQTKVERGKRIFPLSDQATDVRQVLADFLHETGVTIRKNTLVKALLKTGRRIEKLLLSQNELIADRYIICTGGLSYPATGSTGDGLTWAEQLGHTLIPPKPALTPVILKEPWIKELQGLSLKNVHISVYQNNKKQAERLGEALFTHEGMSGPIMLDMSKAIGNLLKKPVHLCIDFKPALAYSVLDARIQRDLQENRKKMFKNSLDKLLPHKLIPVIVRLSGINPAKQAGSFTKEERKRLLHLLKGFTVNVRGLAGFEKAIITTGGIALNEINPQALQSKLIDNLYFAGEILDLDGPTGGYNLQLCWSTGYVAGESAAGEFPQ
jgi:hypothetical protein